MALDQPRQRRALDAAQRLLRQPRGAAWRRPLHRLRNGLLRTLSDKACYELLFAWNHGYRLNWREARTLNEKIQWLKRYNRRGCYRCWADKLAVRRLVAARIGDAHLVPLLAHAKRFEDIAWQELAPPFIVKPSHMSGAARVVHGGSAAELAAVAADCREWLRQDYSKASREAQYAGIEPYVLVERLLTMPDGTELADYKLHCFSGSVAFVQVDQDRHTDHKRNFYDRDWRPLPFTWSICAGARPLWPHGAAVERPARLADLIRLSELLARDFPYLRVDWYVIETRLYFGETTFHPGGGYERILPYEWDVALGKRLSLPQPSA